MTRVHLALPSSLLHFWRLGADTSILSVVTALSMAEQRSSVGRFPVLIMRLCLASKTVKCSHAMLIAVFGEYFPADCEPPSFSSIWQFLPATEAAGSLQTVWVLSPKSTNITLFYFLPALLTYLIVDTPLPHGAIHEVLLMGYLGHQKPNLLAVSASDRDLDFLDALG